MKRKESNFFQVSRRPFQEGILQQLSLPARWLYIILNELEHRYTNKYTDWFYRSNEELAKDANLGITAIKKAKKELAEAGLIEIRQYTPENEREGNVKKHITAYKISD